MYSFPIDSQCTLTKVISLEICLCGGPFKTKHRRKRLPFSHPSPWRFTGWTSVVTEQRSKCLPLPNPGDWPAWMSPAMEQRSERLPFRNLFGLTYLETYSTAVESRCNIPGCNNWSLRLASAVPSEIL